MAGSVSRDGRRDAGPEPGREGQSSDLDLLELVILAVLVVIAVVGLFLASAGGGVYGLGLAIFVVAVIGAFWWVKRYYDRTGSGHG